MIINTKLGVFPKTLRIYINLYYSKNTSMTYVEVLEAKAWHFAKAPGG